jgi:peptidoglycan/xylan/chitin deacetylase (PgdA/CDA1 family)
LLLIAAITAVLAIAFAVWRLRFGYPPRDRPAVLCYHKITPAFCFEGTWTTPRRFLGHIDYLLERGYEFIDETEYLARLEAGPSRGGRSILLTFDDGYCELLRLVSEELAERSVPALVFLVPGYAGRPNTWDLGLGRRPFVHLSWEEARELRRRGMSIGSHGMTHADLTMLGPGRCRIEMERSKRMIEETLGCEVRSFSYPFGRCNEAVKEMARETGYRAAFSLYPGRSNAAVDRYELRRNAVYIIDSRRTVRAKLERGPFFWLEEMKCRAINAVAVLTPLMKRAGARRDK